MKIHRLSSTAADFWSQLQQLTTYQTMLDSELEARVTAILQEVRSSGDAALLEYTRRFDGASCTQMHELLLQPEQFEAAWRSTDATLQEALQMAASRIRRFAEQQRLESWSIEDPLGGNLGQRVTALERVGIYVPGGKAAYPSSVLMNALPASVAGVSEIVMVVPAPDGVVNHLVLAAAHLAGVQRGFKLGGAQAIAALAYGTETVPAVDKIVGPGNAYVAAAKRMVFGVVGIDMIAGPSEILIICDGKCDPRWVAMDLFSQAEHDLDAQAILLSPDRAFLDAVAQAMTGFLASMPRRNIIEASCAQRGALIEVRDLAEAVQIANFIAPEHLELAVAEPEYWLKQIRHAGAIFMGSYTNEVLGDYCAGPNHVLPTARTARFASPLGVYDFQKRTSILHLEASAAQQLGRTAATLARAEGLMAHARAAELRGETNGD